MKKKSSRVVILIILLGGILPVLSYFYFLGKNPGLNPAALAFPLIPASFSQQLTLAVAVMIIKPLYMIIAGVLIAVVWRVRAHDISALRRGLISFLAGETFCGINIVAFNDGSSLLEFLHMYGMVVGFGFIVYAIMEMVDIRILNFSDNTKKCALSGLCRECARSGSGACKARQLLYFLIPALMIVSIVPLLVDIRSVAYSTSILGAGRNLWHPAVYQIFELRFAPVYAIVLFAIAYLFLIFKKGNVSSISKIFAAAGVGALAFSLLRMTFFGVYRDNLVWPNFWEELTELIFVSGTSFLLWLYRRGLGLTRAGQPG